MIGGNGAGKTTWCRQHRDELPEKFYNADSIAEGLGDWNSRTAQEEARRLVDERIREHLTNREDFGFETGEEDDRVGRGSVARTEDACSDGTRSPRYQ